MMAASTQSSSTDVLHKSQSGGALKLLDDLDELASLLGTDISKPRVWKSKSATPSIAEEPATATKVELSVVNSSRGGETFQEALSSGRLNPQTGNYSDKQGNSYRLAEALQKELINADSAAFVNPDTKEVTGIQQAITQGLIQKAGHYIDPNSGKRLKLSECLQRYIIVARDINRDVIKEAPEEEEEEVIVPPLDLAEKQVVEVIDPATQEWIPATIAIAKGIYDVNNDRYFNLKTGELLSTQEAVQRNLVKLGTKMLDSSIDSNDTDVLLEGHITGLKGLDINYSGEILSDDEEPDDFLFTSSPRKSGRDQPAWQGDVTQAGRTDSPHSTAVLASGSPANNGSGEITPHYGSATDVRGSEANDSTSNNELESLGSNSSFVITQSVTVNEYSQLPPATEQQQTHIRLLSMVSNDEGGTLPGNSHPAAEERLEESDSVINTANTSDVTLDLSNFTSSADTTHEGTPSSTRQDQSEVQDQREAEDQREGQEADQSDTEVLGEEGSSTTSYQSSVFDDKGSQERVVQEPEPKPSSVVEVLSTPAVNQSPADLTTRSTSITDSTTVIVSSTRYESYQSQVEQTSLQQTPIQQTPLQQTSPQQQTHQQKQRTHETPPQILPQQHESKQSLRSPDLIIKSGHEQTSPSKIIGKITPNLVSSLTKHLEAKASSIAESESMRSKSRSPSDSYRSSRASLSPIERPDSGASSPSLKQLSQQLATEAIKQRASIQLKDRAPLAGPFNRSASFRDRERVPSASTLKRSKSIHSRDKIPSGAMKPSERLASWREKEKKSLAEKSESGRLPGSLSPIGDNRQYKSKAIPPKPTDQNTGVGNTTSTMNVVKRVADSKQTKDLMNTDTNNNKAPRADLLASVDAVLEKVQTEVEASFASITTPLSVNSNQPITASPSSNQPITTKHTDDHVTNTRQSSTSTDSNPSGGVKTKVEALTSAEHVKTTPEVRPENHKVMEDAFLRASKATRERNHRSPSPNRLASYNPKSPSKVAFAYDPATRKHKMTVYQHNKILSYEVGVKLGLINIKTGRYGDPLTGSVLSIREACLQGLIDDQGPAITDIQTGRCWSLKECVQQNLIDLDIGRLSESRVKALQISMSNDFLASLAVIPHPINLIDAVKVGLLNPHTGVFTQDEKSCTLEKAVSFRLINGESTLVQDPNSQRLYQLSEALRLHLVSGNSGDIMDRETGHMLMTFYGALLCGVYKPVYDAFNLNVIHPGSGQPVNVNQAIRTSLLGQGSCLVYDTQLQKQVSFEEALAGGIIDRPSACYVDKKTGASFSCEKAVELGLIQPIGSEVCANLSLSECVERLYPPPANPARVTAKSVSEMGTLKPQAKSKKPSQYRKQPVKEQPIVPTKKVKDESERAKAVALESGVTVTERVIEIESRRRPKASAHPDNISATEYFTKGDVQVEIQADDESPIDNYEVKLTNAEPHDFDWESLPISPLRERKIVIESKERSLPLRDTEIIIIEREEAGMTIESALELGYINCETREFIHPMSNERMSVKAAIEKEFIHCTEKEAEEAIEAYRRKGSVMEYKTTKEVEYAEDRPQRGIPLREAVEYRHIDVETGKVKDPKSLVLYSLKDAVESRLVDGESAWFMNPSSKRLYSISEAMKNKVMDPYGFWSSHISGKKKSFGDGMTQGCVRLLSSEDHTRCLLTQINKFSVHHVIHPVTMEKVDYNIAVLEGLVNSIDGVYKSPATGDSLPIDEAITKGLIAGVQLSSRTRRELLPPEKVATYTERRTYTITHAKDTVSGKNLAISEARSRGILDDDLTTFKDMRNGKIYSIQEAIDKHYLVATLDDPQAAPSKGAHFVSTKVLTIDSVVNPQTNTVISVNEAVKQGIIDEETGDYANLDHDETLNMTTAIQKGLVKTRPAPTPVDDTLSFSISAVTDPNTGELLTVTDALRHGFLDRGRKHFCNPHTRTVYTLNEAINNGWVHIKSNIDSHGFSYGPRYESPSTAGLQTFTILSVRDVRHAEEVTVPVAIAQGILDSSKQRYRNNVTGEVMTLDQAIKRNLIKLIPTVRGTVRGNPQPTIYQSAGSQYHASQPSISQYHTYSSHGGFGSPAPSTMQRPTLTRDSDRAVDPTIPAHTTSNPAKAEPVYSQIRKTRDRGHNGQGSQPTPSQRPEPIDIYKANTRGLISHQTGEVTVPQYGVNMLIDDALIQGLITTKVPIAMLLYRPFDPSSFAIYEAFQRGFVNPVTLAVRHPATGQFMSLESALTTGLLHPRASANAGQVNIPPINYKGGSVPSQRDNKPRRSESMSRVESDHRRVQRNSASSSVKQPLLIQSQEYHNYSTTQTNYHSRPQHPSSSSEHYQPVKPDRTAHHRNHSLNNGLESGTLTLNNNRAGSHLVNGSLFAAKPGHIINSRGQVVNLTDGEVMSLAQAERLNIVQRLSDNDHQAGQSYVPASNMMFNRDPVPFPNKAESNAGVMVVHVRNNHQPSFPGDGSTINSINQYSTAPNNMPVNLPAHLRQIDHHYAEIRH